MEIQIDLNSIKKNRIFLATPMYGGLAHGDYMTSCLGLITTLGKFGISITFSFLYNESLVTRARNTLVDTFLKSDCTHLLFVDADIGFDPNDVVTLLAFDKDIIGAPVAKKGINWKNVALAARNNLNMDPNELKYLTGTYAFNFKDTNPITSLDEPFEVKEVGAAFTLVKRNVFTVMKAAYPQFAYTDGVNNLHAYYDTMIDSLSSALGNGSNRYLSEDYMFCQLWRKTGGTVFICPWIKITHTGAYQFLGNFPKIAEFIPFASDIV